VLKNSKIEKLDFFVINVEYRKPNLKVPLVTHRWFRNAVSEKLPPLSKNFLILLYAAEIVGSEGQLEFFNSIPPKQ